MSWYAKLLACRDQPVSGKHAWEQTDFVTCHQKPPIVLPNGVGDSRQYIAELHHVRSLALETTCLELSTIDFELEPNGRSYPPKGVRATARGGLLLLASSDEENANCQ